MTGQLILALSLLVFIHELGHFLAAKAFGMKVEKFFIFIDAWGGKLFSFKRGETEYGFGWLPFGGYVKISGMIDESMDKEQLKRDPEPWEFRAKPAWQRLIVLIAGIVMNVILGVIISVCFLLHFGDKYIPTENVTDGIQAYELANKIGLQTGDKILAINGKKTERFSDVLSMKVIFGATLTIDRGGKVMDVKVPDDFFKTLKDAGPDKFIGFRRYDIVIADVLSETAKKSGLKEGDKLIAIDDQKVERSDQVSALVQSRKNDTVNITVERNNQLKQFQVPVDNAGKLGIMHAGVTPYQTADYTLGKAIKFGVRDAFEGVYYGSVVGMMKIFGGDIKPQESLVGPIGMARIYGSTWDWAKFWKLTGLISMVLAFMNLLPIPALDGGHILFVLIEMVTRRKVNEKVMEYAQMAGMIILLGLMVFVIGNDIFNIFK